MTLLPLTPTLASDVASGDGDGIETVVVAKIPYSDTIELAPDRSPARSPARLPSRLRAHVIVEAVLDETNSDAVSAPRSAHHFAIRQRPRINRAISPVRHGAAALGGSSSLFNGDKLLLTNGVTSLEGASGGGIATWATIAGREMDRGVGVSSHLTAIELPDFGWRSYGIAVGIADRLELSYARQNFDTRAAGAALGLGQGYTFNQDVYGAKLRLAGDVVYGANLMPQIAIGAQYKRSLDRPVVSLLGANSHDGIDYTISATKLFLEHSVLVNATARLTKGNQLGLLGFGAAAGGGYALQFEGSLAYQVSRRAVFGAEYRSKPDNLGLGEDDWVDLFAAYAVTDNITVSAAYVDLGSIATFEDQRGGFLQAQVAF